MTEGMLRVSGEDIYKDMHVRGYEYGPKLEGIVEFATDAKVHSFGRVRWTGQMITYLDNLLQLVVVVMPVRELQVPIFFERVKADPLLFFQAIQQNNITSSEIKERTAEESQLVNEGELSVEEAEEMRAKIDAVTGEADLVKSADSVLPVYLSFRDHLIATHGIELYNVTSIYVGRKAHPQPVTIEKQAFQAHFEENIEFDEKKAKELRQYEQIVSGQFHRLLAHFRIKMPQKDAGNWIINQELKERFEKAKEGNELLKIVNLANDQIRNSQADENNNLLIDQADTEADCCRKLSQLLAGCTLKLVPKSNEIVTKPSTRRLEALSLIHSDMLSTVSLEEPLLRPLVDLVAESFASSRDISVLQLSSFKASSLAIKVEAHLAASSIFNLAIDCTLVHPEGVEKEDGTSIPSTVATQTWNLTDNPEWPESIELKGQPQLALLADDPLLRELPLEKSTFWEKLSQSLSQPSAFVLLLQRSQLSPLERLFGESLFNRKMATDKQLKQRIEVTLKAASQVGFTLIASKLAASGQTAFLFTRKDEREKEKVDCVTFESTEEAWLEAVQLKLKKTSEGTDNQTLWLLADGQTLPGALGFFNCLRKEPGGRKVRLLFVPDGPKGSAGKLFKKHQADLISWNLAVNIWKNGKWGSYRYTTSSLLTATRVTRDYHLNFGANRNDLTSLTLYDSAGLRQLTSIPGGTGRPPPAEREYAVYSSALNFRDLMFASGRVHPPLGLLTLNCHLGSEFAGRDAQTGERVFGFHPGGSFASSIHQKPEYVRAIPSEWTYDDAVAYVIAYFTVWYGLVHKAGLIEGSTVLIHSAAGGVGQAALHLAKAYNCTIFATAGNEEKRAYLATEFAIPKERIFSSRDTTFEGAIRRQTEGVGVQYILNSLIGDGLDASLRLVADSGHFVELAKVEAHGNKPIGTFPFLRNLSYYGIAIEQPLFRQSEIVAAFFDWLLSNWGPGKAVQPLSKHIFPIEEVVAAFRFMNSGKHMGKIIIRVREEDDHRSKVISPCKPLSVETRTNFDPTKTYLLVGGCGGVGLELTHWLVKRGAKRIVLTSRSSTRTPYQSLSLASLDEMGKHATFFSNDVTVYSGDLTTEEGIRKMLKEIDGPIGGIFHLAASLNDSLLENMSADSWTQTVSSKATVGVLLDKVSRAVCPQLDYFVCFSSVTSGRGNVGQANYGYANSVLDRLCERRREDGLHGLSLQFGPIDDVGMLSRREDVTKSQASFANVRLQRIYSCLEVLNRALQSDAPVVSSLVFTDRSQEASSGTASDRKLALLWNALGVDPNTVPDHVTLGELGMESMFAVEVQSAVEQQYGVKLTLADIKLMTVGELKKGGLSGGKQEQEKFRQFKEMKTYTQAVNLILPEEAIERINSSEAKGEPVFLLPSVLGIFGSMRLLAEKLTSPVIGLNLTRVINSQVSTVEQAAEAYSKLLREEYPKLKTFKLRAFDYGALIALTMAQSGFPSQIAVIDLKVSPRAAIQLSDEDVNEQLLSFLLDILLSGSVLDEEAKEKVKSRLLRPVQAQVTFEGKVTAIGEELARMQESTNRPQDISEMIHGSVRRARAMVEFERQLVLNKEKVKLGKSRFLILKESPTSLFSKFLSKLEIEHPADSLLEMIEETLEMNAYARNVNDFFQGN